MHRLVLLLVASVACGCTVPIAAHVPSPLPRRTVEVRDRVDVHCVRASLDAQSPYRQPLPEPVESPELAPYLDDVPTELRRTVLAAGLAPLLAPVKRALEQHPGEPTLALVSAEERLDAHVASLEAQVSAMLFEADCTGDEVDRVLYGFERRRNARELALTVSSIVVGATTGIVVGVLEVHDRDSPAGPSVAIAGGVATGALGVAAFTRRPRPLLYRHERNVLAPIASGEDPEHVYPTFVFRMLTLPTTDGSATPREAMLARWEAILEESVPEDRRATARALLFGEGGIYDHALLEARERFLGELESQLNALHRDLELLERYLARLVEGRVEE